VQTLSHPNGWRRDTAQRLLVERNDASVVPSLTSLATTAKDPRTRLHALWTLDGMERLEPATVLQALEDSSRDVRTSAVRLSERWLATGDAAMLKAVIAHGTDADWSVRRQVAASLGEAKGEARDTAIAAVLTRNGDDPIVVDAAISGVAGREAAVLDALVSSSTESPALVASMATLSATLVRARQDDVAQSLFQRLSDKTKPEWQRAAMMTGVEAAVLNSPLPGSSGRGRGNQGGAAPCPTCPGGRAGPGGAPAFPTGTPRAAAPAAPPAARGNTPTIALVLQREPALVSVAGEGNDLGKRATAVLARIGWPGKAGEATATPLSPEEQKRFEAGEQVYKTICEACHQPDGRGREKLAPSLIGSDFAQASDPGVPARILINGKEGQVGLMPPLGASLTDDQVAAVLTFIRRSWGQTASPVAPATVSGVRSQTSSRARPWTNEELQKLIDAGGRQVP
jgi:mono/diheme cytochrome c family protein